MRENIPPGKDRWRNATPMIYQCPLRKSHPVGGLSHLLSLWCKTFITHLNNFLGGKSDHQQLVNHTSQPIFGPSRLPLSFCWSMTDYNDSRQPKELLQTDVFRSGVLKGVGSSKCDKCVCRQYVILHICLH